MVSKKRLLNWCGQPVELQNALTMLPTVLLYINEINNNAAYITSFADGFITHFIYKATHNGMYNIKNVIICGMT